MLFSKRFRALGVVSKQGVERRVLVCFSIEWPFENIDLTGKIDRRRVEDHQVGVGRNPASLGVLLGELRVHPQLVKRGLGVGEVHSPLNRLHLNREPPVFSKQTIFELSKTAARTSHARPENRF